MSGGFEELWVRLGQRACLRHARGHAHGHGHEQGHVRGHGQGHGDGHGRLEVVQAEWSRVRHLAEAEAEELYA
eukprot:900950-Rhodomonas_salina.1